MRTFHSCSDYHNPKALPSRAELQKCQPHNTAKDSARAHIVNLGELGLMILIVLATVTNPQDKEDKLSPQEVPWMLTLSFGAAPLRTV